MAQSQIYRSLRTDCHEIRVLQPQPASCAAIGLPEYNFQYIILDHNQRCTLPVLGGCGSPAYNALSYTWGDGKDTLAISVEGTQKLITRNLYDALAALRTEPITASTPVWADAVCINQDDITERNREVKRMANIYESATNVIVWLGYIPDTWSFWEVQTSSNVNNIVPRCMVQQTAVDSSTEPFENYTSDEVLAMLAIFDRPYWRRIWILQELAFGQPERIFFFWAGTLRHISALYEVNAVFEDVVKTWLQLQDTITAFKSNFKSRKKSSEEETLRKATKESLRDSKWQAEAVHTVAKRALSGSKQQGSTSGITENISNSVIMGKSLDLSPQIQNESTSVVVQSMIQAAFAGQSLHNGLLQKQGPEVKEEYKRMLSFMENELQKAKELMRALEKDQEDREWQMRRTEIQLAVSSASRTLAGILDAASLNMSKVEMDFGVLMRHAMLGKCTDDKDLVYGLLGLQSSDIASHINVDYHLSTERIFSEFSASVIRSRGPNFLCEYGQSLPGVSSNLPSWCVNLSSESNSGNAWGPWSRRWKTFRAGGDSSVDFTFAADNTQMLCSALLHKVDMQAPRLRYRSKDALGKALERVVSCYHPDDRKERSVLYMSPETSSTNPTVVANAEVCREFHAVHSNFVVEGFSLEDMFPAEDDIANWDADLATEALNKVRSNTIFTTTDGKLGLAADVVRDGDYVAVIRGCNIPILLRQYSSGYKIAGMCYVDGLMFGEALSVNTVWKPLVIV